MGLPLFNIFVLRINSIGKKELVRKVSIANVYGRHRRKPGNDASLIPQMITGYLRDVSLVLN